MSCCSARSSRAFSGARSSRMSSAASSTKSGPSRGRPTRASATGITTGGSTKQNGYKSAKQVIQRLADVVSKNGNLLLNIPVRGDGTIDDKEEAIVDRDRRLDASEWRGDLRHAAVARIRRRADRSRPTGMLNEEDAKPFTAEDIRFTRNGRRALRDLPRLARRRRARSVRSARKLLPDAVIERVDLLGGPELQFRRDADALRLTLPPPTGGAFVPVLTGQWQGLRLAHSDRSAARRCR